MKTLLIHAEDATTDFLSTIYDGKDWTIVKKNIGKSRLKALIKEHDIIMMMGHGTEKGLADSDFNFLIDGGYVYLLRDKINIGIWCNADQFFKKHGLKGLATGLIISDYMEANLYCVDATYSEIDESNFKFAQAIKHSLILEDLELTKEKIQETYEVKDGVTEFNQKNIYFFGEDLVFPKNSKIHD
jgi:hypothetical protein